MVAFIESPLQQIETSFLYVKLHGKVFMERPNGFDRDDNKTGMLFYEILVRFEAVYVRMKQNHGQIFSGHFRMTRDSANAFVYMKRE